MIGWVVAMDPTEYQAWLGGGATTDTPVAAGQKLFTDLACVTCHMTTAAGRGPVLSNLFGKTVQLQGGGTATFDEAYIRESIMNPQAKIAAGYQPIMPTFQGLVSEEQLLQLISYVRSLSQPTPDRGTTPPAAVPQAPVR
jgi:cytochrome c oxidase subunit 2